MNNDDRDNMLIRMDGNLQVIANKVEEHDNTLYGNGQPGLTKDVTILKERQDQCPSRNANTVAGKRLGVAYVMMIIAIIGGILSAIALLTGCTRYNARLEVPVLAPDGVTVVATKVVDIDMSYLLQKKEIKKFEIDFLNNILTLENFGSDTSQVVEAVLEKLP